MRAGRTKGSIRRALTAAAALLVGTVGLAVGTAQPASAEAPNMVFHSYDDDVPWGHRGQFAWVIFDRNLDGGTVRWFADGVLLPECVSTVTPGDLTYGCVAGQQLEPGDYPIRVDYSGSAAFDPVSTPGGTLRVSKQGTTITAVTPSTVDPGAPTEVSGLLLGTGTNANDPVVGATLTFSVAGSSCAGTTDAEGIARCTLTAPTFPADMQVDYLGDSRHVNSTAVRPLALNATPTTTTVAVVPNSALWGTSVNATATVSPTPSGGTVEFRTAAGLLPLCSAVPLTGAAATCNFAMPNGGATITATYSGSASHLSSAGNATSTGLEHPTALEIVGHDPLMVGAPAAVEVQLDDTAPGSAAPADESITVALGGASCVATTGPSGAASCTLTPITVGTTLTATFAGTDEFAPSTDTQSVAVDKAPTVLTLSSEPTYFGLPLVVTATVDQADGGTVEFRSGGQPLAACTSQPVTLVAGTWQATCALHPPAAGQALMSAAYSGTANYEASIEVWHLYTVDKAPTELTYTGATTVTVGGALDVSATLTSSATGAGLVGQVVTYQLASDNCIRSTNPAGASGCRLQAPGNAGPASITVTYGGEDRYEPDQIVVPIVVAPAATATVVQVPPTATFGEPTTISALVQPAHLAAGTVAFHVDGTPIAGCEDVEPTLSVPTLVATCVTRDLAAGERQIGASYAGNDDHTASTATAQPLTVAPGPTALEYTGDTTGTIEVPVTVRAQLTRNGTPPATGPLAGRDITFTGAGGTCTDATDASGVAECTITPDEVADSGPITASFAGSAEFQASEASAVLTVERAASTVVLDAPAGAQFGEAVRLTAVVAPTDGDGTVTFRAAPTGAPDVAAVIAGCGDVALALVGADWTATCDTSALPAGALTITAAYSGGARHLPSSATTATAITPAWTAMAYTGASAGMVAAPMTLAATLIAQPGGPPFGQLPFPISAYPMALSPAFPLAGMTVTFALGDLVCTGVTDAGGVASCTVTPTSVAQAGTVQISFAGTSQYASSHATSNVAVAPTATSVTLSAPATAGFSLPVELVATVAPFGPAGTVGFADGGTPIAGCEAVAVNVADGVGTARCSSSTLGLGAHTLTAAFSGNDSYLASASSAHTLTVVAAATTLSVVGPTTATAGSPVTVSARLTATDPAGAAAAAFAGRAVQLGEPTAQQFLAQATDVGVSGQQLLFTLGDATCTGITGADGVASCTLVPTAAAAGETLVVTFTGAAGFAPSRVEAAFAVASAPVPPTGPTAPTPGNPTLPATGGNTMSVLAVACALLAAGLLAVRVRRRRLA